MQVDIQASPSFAMGTIRLGAGESAKVEAGAMAAMSSGVEIATAAQGGLLKGLKRSMLGGESFFINTFTATTGGEISVAPKLPGDLIHLPLAGGAMLVQSGSWIASESSVEVDTKWGGAKTFFSGEGLFMLHCSGAGDMLVSSYGAIVERQLQPGEVYTVDTGHIVAFDEAVTYAVRKVGNWKSTILGGEGLVTDFTGPGRLLLQTRSSQELLDWLTVSLPFTRE
jgi:uncharacterized protein (TIGR00266 family)